MNIMSDLVLPCLWAFLSCVGFCLTFNVRGIGIIMGGLGGALGWFVYSIVLHLSHHSFWSAFLAAISIAIFSEMMARLRHCPVTGYIHLALLPLVPGAGTYYAMRYCVAGETDQFISTLLNTFGMAATLAVGAMLASTVLRIILPRLPLPPPPSSKTISDPHSEGRSL